MSRVERVTESRVFCPALASVHLPPKRVLGEGMIIISHIAFIVIHVLNCNHPFLK
jgi:hypothetical protein